MIASFRHGPRQLYVDDNSRGLNAEHVRKSADFALLDAGKVSATSIGDFGASPKGDLKGFWSLTVRANWRITFRFADGKAFDVDLVDYH